MDQRHTVYVTGGTKGIGYAIAATLAPSCDKLWVTYNSDAEGAEKATEVLRSLLPHGSSLFCTRLDITDTHSAEQQERDFDAEGFCPDVVVYNAGITNRKSLTEISPEEWRTVFEGNVHFPFCLTQRLAPKLPVGTLYLFVGSLMAIHPHSFSLAYGASKAAVHAMVSNLVKHLEPYRQRVAGIAPGFVDSDWQKEKSEELRRRIEGKVATHRFALPDEVGAVAKAIVDNRYFCGDIVTLSGGYSYT